MVVFYIIVKYFAVKSQTLKSGVFEGENVKRYIFFIIQSKRENIACL